MPEQEENSYLDFPLAQLARYYSEDGYSNLTDWVKDQVTTYLHFFLMKKDLTLEAVLSRIEEEIQLILSIDDKLAEVSEKYPQLRGEVGDDFSDTVT